MTEKWQQTQLSNPPESCVTCQDYHLCGSDRREQCIQVRYDHEGYPYQERYLLYVKKG